MIKFLKKDFNSIFLDFSFDFLFELAIRFINSTNKICRAIIGLVKHDPIRGLDGKESVLPTGLVWGPRTEAIFFNGQAAFLQLFDPQQNSMLFNVAITNQSNKNLSIIVSFQK